MLQVHKSLTVLKSRAPLLGLVLSGFRARKIGVQHWCVCVVCLCVCVSVCGMYTYVCMWSVYIHVCGMYLYAYVVCMVCMFIHMDVWVCGWYVCACICVYTCVTS